MRFEWLWLVRDATGRCLLLVALGVLYYVTFEFTQWEPREGELSVPVPLLPIPAAAWYTGAWLLFGVGLVTLLVWRPRPDEPGSDVGMRRIAVAAAAIGFGVELAARLLTVGFFGLEQRTGLGPFLGAALAGCAVLAVLLRWPPRTPVLVALMLGGGLAVRTLWMVLVTPDPRHSDNLFVIRLGLERFFAGETPYAFFDFGTHTNPMPYLPWTFLSYVAPFAAGMDLRVTNFVLSLALVLALWAVVRALPIGPRIRNGLVLALGVFYVLPVSISLDEQTEFPMFNLMLVVAFALLALRRGRLAAVAYGVSLGAMPVAVFCGVPLMCFALRTRPWREVVILVALVLLVAGVPIVAFMLWDPAAFLWAASYTPREAWKTLDLGQSQVPYDTPYVLVWHGLGSWLRVVQAAWFVLFAALAWTRLRTLHGVIALSAGGYLALVLSGPYIGPHLVQVVLFLALLAEAVRAAGLVEDASRTPARVHA